MCTKTSKTPLLLIGGVCFVIVLVGITGVTLINNLNLSNIIKLNEKVASDSMSSHDTELREINYANNHPKNIYKFDEFSAPYALAVATHTYAHASVSAEAAKAYIDESSAYAEAKGERIGQPLAALVDTAANNGNSAAAETMIEQIPQTHATPAAATLVNNPQVDTQQLQVDSTTAGSSHSPTAGDLRSFSAAAAVSTRAPPATIATIASVSASSVNVDIAAKLMLPLILNGSARITTPGISNDNRNQTEFAEQQSFTSEAPWAWPRDNRTKNSTKTYLRMESIAAVGRLQVPHGGPGIDHEKRDAVVKVRS